MVVHSVAGWDARPECVTDEIKGLEISQQLRGLPHRTRNRDSVKVRRRIGTLEYLMNELKRVMDS